MPSSKDESTGNAKATGGSDAPSRVTAKQDTTECIGSLAVSVQAAEPTAKAAERWKNRADSLARWLAAEWQRERASDEPSRKLQTPSATGLETRSVPRHPACWPTG